MDFFIQQISSTGLSFFKNCLRVAHFLQSSAQYANIIHDPKSEYNQQKSELRGVGVFLDLSMGFRELSTLRKFLGSKEHLDWLKIDFNVAEIKKMWMEVHIYSVQAKSKAGNIWVKHIMAT